MDGYITKFTKEEVDLLGTYEGYPVVYDRINVKIQAHFLDGFTGQVTTKEIDGQIFKKLDMGSFHGVYEPYLKACSKTLLTHRMLKGES